MNGKVYLTAKMTAKEGMELEVLKELKKLIQPTRKEKGCISYTLHKIKDNPKSFLFYEVWESAEDLKNHTQSRHFIKAMAALENIIAGKGEIVFLETVEA